LKIILRLKNGSSILSKANDIKHEFPQSEVVSKVAKLSVDQTQNQTSENQIQATRNICVVGHVDSGKSSLIGKIAQIVENSSTPVKSKPNKNSKNEPKSMNLAWFSDELDVEKTKGITVHSIKHQVSYKNQKFCLIDSPGHIDFVPNMINSALKSNIGLLVVDSAVGAFEKGFGGGGQTKEHLLVLKTFAITSLVVVLNKFDVLKESPMERYEEIKSKISKYAKSIGFKLLNFVHALLLLAGMF